MLLEWLRFLLGTAFLVLGTAAFIIQILGIFKFKYVLSRMHAAGIGDTLGIGASLAGLMILSGFNFTTLKLGLILMFLWCASPVSTHLIGRLEVTTNEELEKYCEVKEGALDKEEG